MKKIEVDGSGRLNVPDTVEIPFIEGDGVGAEITPVMQLSLIHISEPTRPY